MKKTIKAICVFIAAVLILSIHTTASASEDRSITLNYSPGVCSFRFYKIADLSTDGQLSLVAPFTDYTDSIDTLDRIGELNADEMRLLSATLEAVVLRDKLTPKYIDSSSQNGVLTITNPERGIYLIIGEQTKDEKYLYTPSPLLVSVPRLSENGSWENHVIIEHTKLQKEEHGNDVTKYRVRKIWKDTGYRSIRPTEITVQLLQNGILYDTVILSKENDWSYEWENLPSDFNWTVVEKKIPNGYFLSVDKKKNGIILTNRYKEPPPPPEEEIPQTGQLWWPVPVLFALGCAFLYLGVLSKKARKHKGERYEKD